MREIKYTKESYWGQMGGNPLHKCEREGCAEEVKHVLWDVEGADGEAIKALCHSHWNRVTQKRSLNKKLARL